MTPELQHALVYLLGTIAIAVPATMRALPSAIERILGAVERASRARADAAKATLVTAETAAGALDELRRRLDEVEYERDQCHMRIAEVQREAQTATAMALDAERRLDTLRREVDDMRRVQASGGVLR